MRNQRTSGNGSGQREKAFKSKAVIPIQLNNVTIQPLMADAHELLQGIRGASSTGVRVTDVPMDAQGAVKELITLTELLSKRVERLRGVVGEIQATFFEEDTQ